MIIGTGIDIVEIDRFKKIKDLKGIAKKILHTNELEEFNKKAKGQTIFLAKNLRLKRLLSKRLELALESLIT
jgi:phosphopantetheinyl transferase (holo-ACP synthase)